MRYLPFLIFVAAAPSAMAALSGSVEITNLRYEITDLRPDDGIDPSHVPLGFDNGGLEVNLNSDLHDYQVKRLSFDKSFGSWSASLARPYGHTSGTVSWTEAGFRFFIEGQADRSGSNRGGFHVNSFAYLSGQLAAYTAVKVIIDYEINLHADAKPEAGKLENVRGDVLLLGSGFVQAAAYANPDFGPQDIKREGQLSFSRVNDSSISMNYASKVLGMGVVARPELIPEPSTNLLMLAGLGVLCVVARRQAKVSPI